MRGTGSRAAILSLHTLQPREKAGKHGKIIIIIYLSNIKITLILLIYYAHLLYAAIAEGGRAIRPVPGFVEKRSCGLA
jgi:hypothetical protein